jgi:hypothetical protein
VDSPEHRKRAARDYFLTQSPGATIEHLERVATERVLHDEYDVWDVHTDDGRWWVISTPMNLYPQDDFKSMDVALSFHIGLTHRVMARFAPPAPDREVVRFPRSWRQIEQADQALRGADEAQDFQAVGMHCREALLTFVRELPLDELLVDGDERPKRADFKGWTALLANRLDDRDRPRSYLKGVANEAWEFTNWLTHAQNAVRHDGFAAVSAALRVITTFAGAVIRWERGEPDRCPECGSYRLDSDLRWNEDQDDVLDEFILCEACGWESVDRSHEPSPEQFREYFDRPPVIPEGECIGGEIGTFESPDDFIRRNG